MGEAVNETRRDDWVMGQGIRSYRPSRFNPNRIVNNFFAQSSRAAFPGREGAIITQQKKIPDVSFWQGEIDWDLMRSKTDTVIFRAGQNVWEDVQFRRNLREAIARRMIWTVYFFYDDRVDPGRQAALLVSLIKDNLPVMEVIIDWENTFGGNFRGLANVVAMMQAVEAALPVTCALYSGYFWFRENSNAIANKFQYAYLKTRPLHLAWYTEDAFEVLVPFPWLELWMWQFGTPAEGPAYGAKSEEIDMNFVNMTTAQFYMRYGGANPLPEPEPEEPMATFFKVTYATVNLRSSALVITSPSNDLGNTDDTNLKLNDIVETENTSVTAGGYTWRKVLRWWRANVEKQLPPSPTSQVWAAEKAGSTGYYMVPVNFTPPTPEPSPSPLPTLQVTVSGEGYESVIVELRPR